MGLRGTERWQDVDRPEERAMRSRRRGGRANLQCDAAENSEYSPGDHRRGYEERGHVDLGPQCPAVEAPLIAAAEKQKKKTGDLLLETWDPRWGYLNTRRG